MTVPFIPFDAGEKLLDWLALCDAFDAGHRLPKAQIDDIFLYRDPDTLLNRAAWIDGMGMAVKSATVFPGTSISNDHRPLRTSSAQRTEPMIVGLTISRSVRLPGWGWMLNRLNPGSSGSMPISFRGMMLPGADPHAWFQVRLGL